MSPSKPKPSFVLPRSIDGLEKETTDAVRAVAGMSHARRATLAALLERGDEGLSAKRGAAMTAYSGSAIRGAWDDLEDAGLATIDADSWPTLAYPTDLSRDADAALTDRFDLDLRQYLDVTNADEDAEESRDDADENETTPSGASGGLGDLSKALGPSRSAPSSSTPESGGSSDAEGGGSGPWTGFADRPAAEWDLEDAGDLDDRDHLAETVIELASDMGSRAQTERMDNLKREQVRADQAQAFALLVLALDRLRDGAE